MALKALHKFPVERPPKDFAVYLSSDAIVYFAHLVLKEERKTCAQLAYKYAKANEESDNMADAFLHFADAIMARNII